MDDDETAYHLAYRDMGGTWTGDGWAPQIRIHITRILHGVINTDFIDYEPGAKRWILRNLEGTADRLWATWFYVEHHEWLHALMHRWKQKGWASERGVTWGARRILESIFEPDPRDGPFEESDFIGFRP